MGARRNPYLLINRGLVLDSMMWEGVGNIVEDLSGNRYTGTFQGGGITWVAGENGPAIAVPASGSYVSLARHPLTSFPCTIVVWFYLNDLASNQGESCIIGISDSSSTDFLLLRVDDADDKIDFSVRFNGEDTQAATTTTTVPAKTWGMATAVYRSATDRSVFYNAAGEGINTNSVAFPGNITATLFGARNLGSITNHLDGRIGRILFYNRILAASEAALLYREPFCGFRWTNIVELASYIAVVGGNPMLLEGQLINSPLLNGRLVA